MTTAIIPSHSICPVITGHTRPTKLKSLVSNYAALFPVGHSHIHCVLYVKLALPGLYLRNDVQSIDTYKVNKHTAYNVLSLYLIYSNK